MDSRPKRTKCGNQTSFWKLEKCLAFLLCSAVCKGTSVGREKHLRKHHHCFSQSHRKYSRPILPLRIACPSQGRSTWKVHSGWPVSPNFTCILSGVAEIHSPIEVRQCSSMSPGPARSESGHVFPIGTCLAIWNNTVRQTQHSHEHKQHQWPRSVL